MVTCNICGKEIVSDSPYTTGYGIDENNNKVCYACCGEQDTEYMKTHDKTMLYLVKRENDWYVTNWPGTLSVKVATPKKGRHNIARTRYDVWFAFADKFWHGVQYGDFTQVCHCKVVKGF